MDTNFIGGREACEILGVHRNTLYSWEKKGTIEVFRNTPRGKRYYNIKKFMQNKGMICNTNKITKTIKCSKVETIEDQERINVCYARVSTVNQKDDLERQKSVLMEHYPDYQLIQDIGSGINLTKKSLLKIIDWAVEGKIETLVIVHKDRLARFGYDLIKYFIETYSNGKIVIINQDEEIEPEEELVKDVIQIMTVFVAKINGRRKYKTMKTVKNSEKS